MFAVCPTIRRPAFRKGGANGGPLRLAVLEEAQQRPHAAAARLGRRATST